MIELYLQSKKTEKRDYLGMSAMGYCPLQNFYLLSNNVEKKVPGNVLERFDIGKALHDKVIKFFIENYPNRFIAGDYDEAMELELKTFKGNAIKGHFDLYDKIEKEVVDFKFYDHSGWSYVKEPHKHYIAQQTLYIEALNKKGYECKRAKLIYVSTKTFQEKIFYVEPDPQYAEFLLDVYDMIILKNEEKLKQISPFDEWECKYCQFADTCEKAIKTEKITINNVIDIDTQELAELLKQKKELEEKIEELKSKLPETINYEDDYIKITTVESLRKEIDKNKLQEFLKTYNKMLADFEEQKKNVYKKIIAK
ncbi:MAG: PD-(D/E)XK nuclease family protein [Endomicrobiia bacterium]